MRPTPMRLTLSLAALAAVPALLTGCGSETGDQVGTAAPPSPSPGETPPSPEAPDPHTHPTEPPWPSFTAEDYRYRLQVMCFCGYAGVPFTVTVRDGTVSDVVYARSGRGFQAGKQVGMPWLRLTIDDIIARANDPKVSKVHVRWPEGQAYPAYVWVDPVPNAADDEIGYRIRDVERPGAAGS